MESKQSPEQHAQSERHDREQSDEPIKPAARVTLTADPPLEGNMTDEPGGDPYNHTGSFERLYR